MMSQSYRYHSEGHQASAVADTLDGPVEVIQSMAMDRQASELLTNFQHEERRILDACRPRTIEDCRDGIQEKIDSLAIDRDFAAGSLLKIANDKINVQKSYLSRLEQRNPEDPDVIAAKLACKTEIEDQEVEAEACIDLIKERDRKLAAVESISYNELVIANDNFVSLAQIVECRELTIDELNRISDQERIAAHRGNYVFYVMTKIYYINGKQYTDSRLMRIALSAEFAVAKAGTGTHEIYKDIDTARCVYLLDKKGLVEQARERGQTHLPIRSHSPRDQIYVTAGPVGKSYYPSRPGRVYKKMTKYVLIQGMAYMLSEDIITNGTRDGIEAARMEYARKPLSIQERVSIAQNDFMIFNFIDSALKTSGRAAANHFSADELHYHPYRP